MPWYLTCSDFLSFYTDWQKLGIPTTFLQELLQELLQLQFSENFFADKFAFARHAISDSSVWQWTYSLKDIILRILKLYMWLPIG